MTLIFIKVTSVIGSIGYWGIAICMAIESCNIPLPSEFILPFGGYLVFKGQLTFWGAVLAGTIGGTAGSIVSYYIGLIGGRAFLEKHGRYLGLPKHRLEAADRWLARYGRATTFVTRLIPGVRTFISLPVGALKGNIVDFIVFTFIGTLVWSIFLTYVGQVLGENWGEIRSWFHSIDLIVVIAVVGLAAYLFWKRRSKNQKESED
jgi:membrane protein DedA with SNARE-associated domain